ncbi:unnamed protein product [Strongylus vulgaris]|nr:unnamed protein product [Strongylus vulgaris]
MEDDGDEEDKLGKSKKQAEALAESACRSAAENSGVRSASDT